MSETVTLLLERKNVEGIVRYYPADGETKIYLTQRIGVTQLTEGDLSLLKMLEGAGFKEFTIKVVPTNE